MAPTDLMLAGASAVLVPTLAEPLLRKIPGGNVGFAVAGAVMIYGGTKVTNGHMKALLVGTGAGIVVAALASYIIKPAATATA